jgi:hypothetical protein
MAPGCLLVRATLADLADKAPFNAWYEAEHLPMAVRLLGADTACRFWSARLPCAHYALYFFGSPARLTAALESRGYGELIAHFDAAWGTRVKRVRDALYGAQVLDSGSLPKCLR